MVSYYYILALAGILGGIISSRFKLFDTSSHVFQLSSYTLNFFFVIWNISLSLTLAAIAKDSNAMSAETLLTLAEFFAGLAVLVFGFFIGQIIVAVYRSGKSKKEKRKDKQNLETQGASNNITDIVTGIALITNAIINMTKKSKGKDD